MARAYYKKHSVQRQTQSGGDPRLWSAACDVCPLRGCKPVWGDGLVGAALAVVGEAPGREEEMHGAPFLGKSGEYVENLLSREGLNRSEVWLDNSFMCMPPGGDLKSFRTVAKKAAKKENKPYVDPVDACRPRLMKALGVKRCKRCTHFDCIADPCRCEKPIWVHVKGRGEVKAVWALGNSALKSLLGHDGIQAKQLYEFETGLKGDGE